MIKSKIDARERALEMAVKCFDVQSEFGAANVVGFANVFEQYLTGDAELPEVTDDNAYLKELFEVAKREMEKINKRDTPDYEELLKAIQTGNAVISAKVSCKSEAE